MSQLDISISFGHFFGLVICFYFFVYCVSILLFSFWCNYKFRFFINSRDLYYFDFNDFNFIKRILLL